MHASTPHRPRLTSPRAAQEGALDLDVRMHLQDAAKIRAADEGVNAALLAAAQAELERMRSVCADQAAQDACAPSVEAARSPAAEAPRHEVAAEVLRDRTALLGRLAEEYRHACDRALSVNSALVATERAAASQVGGGGVAGAAHTGFRETWASGAPREQCRASRAAQARPW